MRPNVMPSGSMAGGQGGSVQRFAGSQLAQLEALSSQMGMGLQAQWRAETGKRWAETEEEIARMFPEGIGGGGAQSGPDYGQAGGTIGRGLKGMFGGSKGSSSGDRKSVV